MSCISAFFLEFRSLVHTHIYLEFKFLNIENAAIFGARATSLI